MFNFPLICFRDRYNIIADEIDAEIFEQCSFLIIKCLHENCAKGN